MAESDFTLPSITIADDWEFDGRYRWSSLTFHIPTSVGTIKVETVGYTFYCTGPADALVEHGLIKPEWLPGLPGNNKVSQRVAFGENGPSLIVGNLRGTCIPKSL